MKTTPKLLMSVGMLMMLTPYALGQWSADPSVHLVVADGPGEQVQPKIVATPDGGCYISWYTSQFGYDVRLQRLDAAGNEMWAHNGILIADRGFSSTQDYGLDVDTSGNAVIAFRDDRFGGVKVTAQSIAPDGSALWGANGIQFANGTDFVASPDVAATTDGSTVVAWINNSDTDLAKIDTNGSVVWTSSLTDPGGSGINLASMHGSDSGSVIVSWVQFAAFFDPKHLYAQKINPDGTEAWASRVAVFDGGSLQFGNFPEFVADDSGGAVFSWYDTANGLNVFAQHLASDGTESFPHNGATVSTAPRERVAPTAGYDPATSSVIVSWVELANNQGSQGIYTQRLDPTGARMWTDTGIELSPVDGTPSGTVNVQVMDKAITTIWIQGDGQNNHDQIHAYALDASGADSWGDGTVVIASDFAQRSRLKTALSSDGFVIEGWQAGDFGVADLESHNINPDGTLGTAGCPADLNGDGVLNFFDVSAFLAAFTAQDPAADFTNDGVYNFFDVSAFLAAFSQGCP
jgi:hypothetical protein